VFHFGAKITAEDILQPVGRTLRCLDQFAANKTSNEAVGLFRFRYCHTREDHLRVCEPPAGSSSLLRMTREKVNLVYRFEVGVTAKGKKSYRKRKNRSGKSAIIWCAVKGT
jgi:hypothetical protein